MKLHGRPLMSFFDVKCIINKKLNIESAEKTIPYIVECYINITKIYKMLQKINK